MYKGQLEVCIVRVVWLLMMIIMMIPNVTLTMGSLHADNPPPLLCCQWPDGLASVKFNYTELGRHVCSTERRPGSQHACLFLVLDIYLNMYEGLIKL